MSNKTTVQCDRCGKMTEGVINIDGDVLGFKDVNHGHWHTFQRWDEQYVCDVCLHVDPKYLFMHKDD